MKKHNVGMGESLPGRLRNVASFTPGLNAIQLLALRDTHHDHAMTQDHLGTPCGIVNCRSLVASHESQATGLNQGVGYKIIIWKYLILKTFND